MDDKDIVIEAFTELAPDYQATMERELRQFWGVGYEEFISRLLGMLEWRPDDVILDVATGTAFIPLLLGGKRGAQNHIVGLDITLAMLQHARRKMAAARLPSTIAVVCGSGMVMPFRARAFDVLICALGTHHMDVPHMLAEMKRVLRPGGQLLLADVRATAFWRSRAGAFVLRILLVLYGLALRSARAQAEMEAFASVRTTDEWRALLTDFGFENIELQELSALRRWYPGGLIMKAIAGDSEHRF